MGEGIRHFRSATDDIQREILKGTNNIKSEYKKATDLRSKPNKTTTSSSDSDQSTKSEAGEKANKA